MDLQLMNLRKKAGFQNRKDFAAVVGITEAKLKSWETGTRRFPLEDACRIADFFRVSLDELAGRWEYVDSIPSATPDELRLVDNYRASDQRGKGNILDTSEREKSASSGDVVHVEGKVRAG